MMSLKIETTPIHSLKTARLYASKLEQEVLAQPQGLPVELFLTYFFLLFHTDLCDNIFKQRDVELANSSI